MIMDQGSTDEKVRKSGSPQSGEPLSIAVGKIRKPHGVMGEVVFEPFPEYSVVLKKGKAILVGKKKEIYTIRSIRKMDQNYLIAFDGFNDCDAVGHLRNQLVYFKTEQLEDLPNGQHYPHQVLGMQVIDENGEIVGRLVEVLITGANDVYVVKSEGNETEVLLPAIDLVILNVDSEKKVITVRLPIWD